MTGKHAVITSAEQVRGRRTRRNGKMTGKQAERFADLEAVLVREGLRLRRAEKRKTLPSPASGRGEEFQTQSHRRR